MTARRSSTASASRDQLEASEQAVRGPREDTAREAGADDVDVQFFEVVIDEEVS